MLYDTELMTLSYINLCWVMGKPLSAYEHVSVLISYIGQFIAAGVMVSVQSRPDEWAYRVSLALPQVALNTDDHRSPLLVSGPGLSP
jgi:hypothetical protein